MGYDEVVCESSTAPLSISGISTICKGESAILTLVGGSAGTGATAKWYSGSCGGTLVGTGNSISVSPTVNTTYFVRYEGACGTTVCASQLITVNSLSTAPLSISGVSTICNGGSTTLIIVGGSAGTGGVAKWYSGTCGGTPEGTGYSIIVSPTANTTYFVRYEGTCNTTACASQLITVNTLSIAPLSISGISTICNGGNTTLTMVGGSAGTGATAKWYSGSCGSTPEGTGNSITVSPTANTTYYVRYEGICNTTSCASVTVNINFPSIGGTLSPAQTAVCGGTAVELTLTDNTGIITEWEKQENCTGSWTSMGSGGVNMLSLTPAVTTCYRIKTTNGVCPATNSSVATIEVDQPAVGGKVTVSNNTSIIQASICPNQFVILKVTGYTGVIAGWQSNLMNSPVWRDIPFTANQVNLTVNGASISSAIFYRAKIYTSLGLCIGNKAVAYSSVFRVSKKANCAPSPSQSVAPLLVNKGVPFNPLTLVKAYPIPSNSQITLEIEGFTEGVTQIEIMDLTGKVVQRSSQNVLDGFNELKVDIQNLSNGFYLVKVKDSSNQEAVLKVSKM